jgi:hypothetical protein
MQMLINTMKKIKTPENSGFHGEKDSFRSKAPCFSVISVVKTFLSDIFQSSVTILR